MIVNLRDFLSTYVQEAVGEWLEVQDIPQSKHELFYSVLRKKIQERVEGFLHRNAIIATAIEIARHDEFKPDKLKLVWQNSQIGEIVLAGKVIGQARTFPINGMSTNIYILDKISDALIVEVDSFYSGNEPEKPEFVIVHPNKGQSKYSYSLIFTQWEDVQKVVDGFFNVKEWGK